MYGVIVRLLYLLQEYMNGVFKLASRYMDGGREMSKFSAFVMFFMKIRLSLFDEDIGFRFGCHASAVSRNFHKVLDVLVMCTADC